MNNPTDTGLSSTDATGVILNNDDLLESCAWIPTVIPQAPQYVFPGEEHTAPLYSRTWLEEE